MRYIIRSENTQSDLTELNIYDADTLFMIMKELYKFKDEIGYNSWLYIITTNYENTPIWKTGNCNISFSYTVNNNIARRYWDATNDNSSDYRTSSKYYTVPRAVLLINEKNECRYVELSTKLINKLMKIKQKDEDGYYINLGRIIFAIDATYQSSLNQIIYWKSDNAGNDFKVPIDLIPFISKNIPSITNYNIYETTAPIHIKQFIETNLEDIKKDLLIEEPKTILPSIQYIKINTLISEEKAKRKAELLEELRKLDEE